MKKFDESIKNIIISKDEDHYNMEIHTDIPSFNLFPELKCLKKIDEESEIHYGEKDKLIQFGIWYTNINKRNKNNVYWNINGKKLKELTGIEVVEITVVPLEGIRYPAFIHKDFAKILCPQGFIIKENKNNLYICKED